MKVTREALEHLRTRPPGRNPAADDGAEWPYPLRPGMTGSFSASDATERQSPPADTRKGSRR